MLTRELLLQSPRFVMPADDDQTSLPARVHAVFPNGQPFLFDHADNIALYPGSTDWIICDVDNPEQVRLISYEAFFDHYQPETTEGWKYLSDLFASQPETASDAPASSEETLIEETLTEEAPAAAVVEFHADQYVMEERLVCECGGHELSVRASGDMDGDIEIVFWKLGCRPYRPKWATRLRQIWDILTRGHAYSDMVTLNRAEQAKLVEIISKSHDLSERYEAARAEWLASRPQPKREVFTIQEVAELQANHEAEKQELLEIIETLSVKLQPQS
jgi:hypothetical protein